MTDADRVIYGAFMDAPYDGFHAQLSIDYAARKCGVTQERVREAIYAANPDYVEHVRRLGLSTTP